MSDYPDNALRALPGASIGFQWAPHYAVGWYQDIPAYTVADLHFSDWEEGYTYTAALLSGYTNSTTHLRHWAYQNDFLFLEGYAAGGFAYPLAQGQLIRFVTGDELDFYIYNHRDITRTVEACFMFYREAN